MPIQKDLGAVTPFGVAVENGYSGTKEEYNDYLATAPARLAELEKRIAELLYKAISITSFTNNVGTAEKGETVTAVTLNWSLNKAPKTLTLDGETLDTGLRTKQLTDQNITSNKSWTLTATDERDTTVSKTTEIAFYNGAYYGAATLPTNIDSAFVLTLTKVLTSSRKRTITVTAGEGEYIFYAIPSSFGTPAFFVGGFEGGFNLVKTFQFTNSKGYTEEYSVWQSANAGLGATTVEVT